MIESLHLLIKLVIVHLVVDFFLQPKSWVKQRDALHWKSPKLYLHAGMHGLLSLLVLWSWDYWFIAVIIAVTHFLVDVGKSYQQKKPTLWFIVDQGLHLLILIVLWIAFVVKVESIDWMLIFDNSRVMYVIGAYLLLTRPAAIFIGIATQKWRKTIEDEKKKTLKDAGAWIGIIERILILTFILVGQDGAIGFLLAAKSIFRFGDLRELNEKNQTEYLLIGTLLSFGLAVFVGYGMRLFGL